MNGLKDIKDDIQNIAEAMLSVLNIDVTIVDENLDKNCWDRNIFRKNRR